MIARFLMSKGLVLLKKALLRSQKQLDQINKKYEKQLPDLQKFLMSRVKDNITAEGTLKVAMSQNQTQALMTQAGLSKYADSWYLSDIYKDAGKKAIQMIPEVGEFFAIPEKTVEFAVSEARLGMSAVAKQITKKIWNHLRESAITPTPLNVMASRLSAETDLLRSQAKTLVNTGLAQVQRQVQTEASESFNPEELVFLYIGPDDQKTRPFCHALEGKACTKQQITKLNNAQGLPVMANGGGYNCRHRWVPVSRDFAKDHEIEMCTSADIENANSVAGSKR